MVREVENSSKDMEDMRVNLASFIQESSNNDDKLNRDLGIVEEECATLEWSLIKTKDSFKTVKGQLNCLTKAVRDLQSANAELKTKLDVEGTAKQVELECVNYKWRGR